MAEQTVQKQRHSSMEEGAINELLESDKFVDAMRKNLGLKEEKVKVCDFCERKVEVKQLKPDNFPTLENKRAAHYCGQCKKIVKEPLIKTKWVERERTLMDKHGVEMFITYIRGSADKIQFTSNLNEREIESIMERLHRKISEELFQQWESYGIENKAMAHKVVAISTNLIYTGLKRALEGKTLDVVGNMGDDRTVKHAESGKSEKSRLRDKFSLS